MRAPLDRILGREAHVRLLRVLALRTEPVSAADLARLSALDATGVRRALTHLANAGIIEALGSGRGQQMRLREAHPLSEPVRALFERERQRARAVIEAVQRAVRSLDPAPHAAWLVDSVAHTSLDFTTPLVVGVLTGTTDVARASEQLRRTLADVETHEGVTFDVRVWTRPDLAALAPEQRAELANARPIMGPPPLAYVTHAAPVDGTAADTRHGGHGYLDERARALGAAVARKLANDPELVHRARAAIASRIDHASPNERPALEEWQQLLRAMPLATLRQFLVDRGPRATRLRQSLPFTDVLTPEERDAVLAGTAQRDAVDQ